MFKSWILGVLLIAYIATYTRAAPQPVPQPQFGGGDGLPIWPPAQYEYSYDVTAPEYGTDFGHAERRNGDQTQGQYRVLLPDGRVQIVTYTVDGPSGYIAQVHYE